MLNQIKTVLLLGLLTGLLLVIGSFWGQSGLIIAFAIAILLNFASYWFSDKIVLRLYRAKEANVSQYPRLYQLINELAKKAKIPVPKIYTIPSQAPNAFATGRNPQHAAVAVTEGILTTLTERELKGVLAHEMAHVKNRDILISSIAATIAGAIGFVGAMARWSTLFGGRGNRNIFGLLAVAIVMPIAALIIRLAISRSREYLADATGAKFAGNSKGLASALKKLEASTKHNPLRFGSESSAHMFIVNPFKRSFVTGLFSTHPSTEARVKRLNSIKV